MSEAAIVTPDGVSASTQPIETSYVDPDERVLDPSKLQGTLLERMPNPTGWRLLILPYRGKGMTSGGIALSKQTIDEDQIQTVVGYVFNPFSASSYTFYLMQSGNMSGTNFRSLKQIAVLKELSSITGVQVVVNGGNLTAAKIRTYGLRVDT